MSPSDIFTQLTSPFLSPESRTYWPGLMLTLVIMLVFQWKQTREAVQTSSFWLDVQLFLGRQILGMISISTALGTTLWLSTRTVLWLDKTFFVPQITIFSTTTINILYSITLFIVWDFSRYLLHRWMHTIPLLWNFHQVHHSAERLTPLTHYRLHPLESGLYIIRSIISTTLVVALFYWLFRTNIKGYTLLGVPAAGFILNSLFGNLRHSEIWLSYPAILERWFVSPAQHQIHHSIAPEHYGKNYGTWLSIWDRLGNTLLISNNQKIVFGVPNNERNHGDDIVSAWFSPIRNSISFKTVFFVSLGILPTSIGYAQEPQNNEEETEETEESDGDGHIIIYSDDGTIREAGSAHVLSEESLLRFSFTNVERQLEQIPGMSIRTEDGFGLRPNIGIRGANSDRSSKITLMEDGVLLAPAPYAAPAAYYFPMTQRIVGIEVFKGSASTRHGPNTVGGALNLISRPTPSKLSGHTSVGAGLFGTNTAHAWVGNEAFIVEGVHLRSNGFKELDTQGDTGFERTELVTKFTHRFSEKQLIRAKLGYAIEDSRETYLGLSMSDFEDNPLRRYSASSLGDMKWSRSQATFHWKYKTDSLQISSDAYIHTLDRTWTKFNRFFGGPDTHTLLISDPQGGQGAVYLDILRGEENSLETEQLVMIGPNDRRYQSKGLQTQLKWKKNTDIFENTLEVGARIHRDDVTRNHTEHPYAMQDGVLEREELDTVTLLHADTQANALAIYIHDDFAWNNLHLFPSTRLEVIQGAFKHVDEEWDESVTRTSILPGFGAMYTFDDWTDVFAGVHKGFSPVAPGQPKEIQPEESINYEVGVRLQEDEKHAEIIGFFNDYQNITGQCTFSGGCTGDQIDTQYNGGRAWIYGLESLFRYTLSPSPNIHFPVELTYTFTNPQFKTGFTSSYPQFGSVKQGDSLPYVSMHQGRVQFGTTISNLSSFLGATYRSGMLDKASTFENGVVIPSILLLDATVQYKWKKCALQLTVQNITNEQKISSWRPFGARPNMPRQILFNLSFFQ